MPMSSLRGKLRARERLATPEREDGHLRTMGVGVTASQLGQRELCVDISDLKANASTELEHPPGKSTLVDDSGAEVETYAVREID